MPGMVVVLGEEDAHGSGLLRCVKNHRDEVLAKCKEIIEEHKLNMKLLDLKYTYKDKKLVFYYTAPERVDFRQLVKELAHEFKLRIELRQVRDREEGKHIGGIGNCGKELLLLQVEG